MYDLLMGDDGDAILMMPGLNYARGNCDAIYQMLNDDNAVIGLADGGAHCGLICDASSTTSLLTHWVRDRPGPRVPLEDAIRKQCAETAALFGLHDRGVLGRRQARRRQRHRPRPPPAARPVPGLRPASWRDALPPGRRPATWPPSCAARSCAITTRTPVLAPAVC